jgi:hypothetical protein
MDEKTTQNCLEVELTYTLSRDMEADGFKSPGVGRIILGVFNTNGNSISHKL